MPLYRWWRHAEGSAALLAAHPPEADEAHFDAAIRDLAAHWTPRVALSLIAVPLAIWPFDLFAEGPAFSALTDMRLSAIGVAAVALTASTFTPVLARAPRVFAAAALAVGIFLVAWSISGGGGLDQPWFHYLSSISALTVFVPVPLRPRIAVAASCALASVGGYFLREPSHLDHPTLGYALGQATFSVFMAIGLGHLIYALTRRAHLQRYDLARQRARLAALSASLSAQVAEQTQELRHLAHGLDRAIDTERRQLAGEVHDQLGQELTALGYALGAVRRRASDMPPPLLAALGEADHLLARTRDTMRRILTRLGPQALEQLGLAGALRWAAHDTAARAGLAVTVHAPADAESAAVPPAVARALFLAGLEGLHNAVRHAHARALRLTLTISGGAATLALEDDGRGPAPTAQSLGQGLGLLTLRERARALGGDAQWGPRPDAPGFALRVELPCAPPRDALAPPRDAVTPTSPADEALPA